MGRSKCDERSVFEHLELRNAHQGEQPRCVVDNKSLVPEIWPLDRPVTQGTSCAWHYGLLVTMTLHMTHDRPLKSLSVAKPSEKIASFTSRLTREQLECLSRCARGISVRFERSEIVDALINGGYAEKGLVGVVTVTAKGQEYLQTHVR